MTDDDLLPPSAPEAQGIPSTAILSFLDDAEARIDALHSLMLVRHGQVVAQGWWHPYRADRKHMLFSLSKSFTSTAIGLAVAEGRLTVDDPVLPFFPDATPAEVSPHLAAMRVWHLLTMTTGHATDPPLTSGERAGGDWVAAILDHPVEHEPGSHFVYNSGASHLLSAIVQRLTGVTMLDYLRPRLLEPLGITEATWETSPRGVTAGGWGLSLRTADVARFGQLYLNEGVWNGRRLLSADWIREATGHRVSNAGGDRSVDSTQGYGYQFWRSRHGAYRADGAFGQLCVVMPEQDAVLTLTGGVPDMAAVLDLVWAHLLPAMAPGPLPADDPARQRLEQRLAALKLPAVRDGTSPLGPQVSKRTYLVADPLPATADPGGPPTIAAITFTAREDGWAVDLRDAYGTHELVCADGEWRLTDTVIGPDRVVPVAASGGWVAGDVFELRLCYPETPFIRTYSCRFDEAELVINARDNVSFGPTDHPPVIANAT